MDRLVGINRSAADARRGHDRDAGVADSMITGCVYYAPVTTPIRYFFGFFSHHHYHITPHARFNTVPPLESLVYRWTNMKKTCNMSTLLYQHLRSELVPPRVKSLAAAWQVWHSANEGGGRGHDPHRLF